MTCPTHCNHFNLALVVSSLVMAVASWSGCWTVIEQPANSAMPKCQPLRDVLQSIGAAKFVTWLGSFGGDSAKPLQLWSARDLAALHRPKPAPGSLQQLCVHDSERKTYSGDQKKLVSSQAYTYLSFSHNNFCLLYTSPSPRD